MPTWAIVVLTLGSAAVAASSVLIATRLQLRHSAQGRRAADSARMRERAALAVAPVLSLLDDTEPQRLTSVPDTRTLTIMNELWERWRALRDPLLAFGAAHPSGDVDRRVRELATDVSNALTSVHWLVHDLPESWSAEALETAKKDHATARRRADELLAALRA
jgi:hypothetical protein